MADRTPEPGEPVNEYERTPVPQTARLGLTERMSLPSVKTWMLVFSLIWFATVPLWMDRKSDR